MEMPMASLRKLKKDLFNVIEYIHKAHTQKKRKKKIEIGNDGNVKSQMNGDKYYRMNENRLRP